MKSITKQELFLIINYKKTGLIISLIALILFATVPMSGFATSQTCANNSTIHKNGTGSILKDVKEIFEVMNPSVVVKNIISQILPFAKNNTTSKSIAGAKIGSKMKELTPASKPVHRVKPTKPARPEVLEGLDYSWGYWVLSRTSCKNKTK